VVKDNKSQKHNCIIFFVTVLNSHPKIEAETSDVNAMCLEFGAMPTMTGFAMYESAHCMILMKTVAHEV